MKALTFFAMCATAALTAGAANTWYVNADHYGQSGLTGKTEELAYGTIQDAISAASNGDTIYVAPGVYSNGLGKAVASWGKSRIGWNNKKLYLYSTGDASNTHIVGEKDTSTELGTGPNAVRCFSMYDYQNASCGGTIFKGFTFRDGSTVTALSEGESLQSQALQGGAIRISHSDIFFVDCVFSNCSAMGAGAVFNGTFIRCVFKDNHVASSGTSIVGGDAPGSPARLYSCLLHHNGWGLDNANSGGGILLSGATSVNCTLMDNAFGSFCYSANDYMYNSVIISSGGTTANSTVVNCVRKADDPYPVMDTIHGDFRLRAGGVACTAGDAQYLSLIPLPPGEDYTDLGGTLPATSGPIPAGVTHAVCQPAAGCLMIDNTTTEVDGFKCRSGSYVFPEVYPTQYLLTVTVADASKRVAFFYFGDKSPASNYDYRFPMRDDKLWVMPPASTTAVLTNKSASVQKITYVSPNADASIADGSVDKPYRTLQEAYNRGTGIIVAKPGVYAEGVTNSSTYGRSILQVGNVKRVTSEAGPEQTIILGAADMSEEHGCGPNAVRCVTAVGNMTQVQGFTLTGGHATTWADTTKGYGGGAYGNDYLDLDDCIITNNCAYVGGAVYNGRMVRTYVAKNRSRSYVAYGGEYCGSVFEDNEIETTTSGLFGSGTHLYHCIVKAASGQNPYSTDTVRRYATVFLGGNSARNTSISAGSICWGAATVYDPNMLVADPLLADPDNGDWHPFVASPVFTAGVVPTADNYGQYYFKFVKTDFEGNPITFNDGKPVVGAFMKPTTRRMVAIYAENGGLSPAATRVEVGEGETCTIGVGGDVTRPISGVTVNGVTNEIPSGAWTLTVSDVEAEGGYSVVALYSNVWYAAPDGDDTANGCFQSSPKTLQGALSNACLVAGDRVVALPGTYRTGKMIQSGNFMLHSRAVVPSQVTLESRDGRDATVIEGARAETPDPPPGTTTYDVRGCGVDALRCVYLEPSAKVKGFTLTNGWTRTMVGGTEVHHESAETCGGGAFCVDASSVVEDCLAIGCGAYRGAGAKYGLCLNSTFANNYALYGGGGTSDSYNSGCISYGNTAMAWNVNAGIFYIRSAVNCTALDSLSQAPGTIRGITNCLVLGTFFPSGIPSNKVSHCIFNKAKLYGMPDGYMDWTTASLTTNLDAIAVDGGNRPIIGQSLAVDAGTLDLPVKVKLPSKDQTGMQRVYNGAIDIGALEADWRPRFTDDISRSSRFEVTNATEQVTESAQGTVRLAPGEELSATWAGLSGRSVRTVLTVRVTGTGALTATLDDGTVIGEVTSADGDRELTFSVPSAGCGLNLSYARTDGDTGYAEVFGTEICTGTSIRLR